MIRITDSHVVISDEVVYAEYNGKSTDEKPTIFGQILNIVNGERVLKDIAISTGSVFVEIDTGNVFFFDEDSSSWLKVGEWHG